MLNLRASLFLILRIGDCLVTECCDYDVNIQRTFSAKITEGFPSSPRFVANWSPFSQNNYFNLIINYFVQMSGSLTIHGNFENLQKRRMFSDRGERLGKLGECLEKI